MTQIIAPALDIKDWSHAWSDRYIFSFPLRRMMQRMVVFKVNRILEAKLKTKETQAAEEYLMDILKPDYAAAYAGLKDVLYQYVKNVLTETTVKGTGEDLFMRNLERWSRAPEFMDAFTKKGL